MRRPALAAALVAAVVAAALVAGCGGGDDEDAATTTTATVPAELRDFCDAFGALIAGPLTDAGTDVRDPVVLQGAVELTRGLLGIVAASAPPDLADDAAAFVEEYTAGFAVWERYGYDLARIDAEATPEEEAVLDAFLAPPQGPGATDPLAVLEAGYFDRCAAGVTLPDDVLPTTPTNP